MLRTEPSPPGIPQRLRSVPTIAGTLLLAAGVAAVQGSPAGSALGAMLVLVLVPCALIDLDRRIIPNRITGPGALLAVALGLALDPGGEPSRLLWAGICGGFLLVAALAHPGGMGIGDVKLVAVIGLLLGAPVIVALLLALLGNVLTGIVLAARHGVSRARRTQLPFAPYLAVGGIIAALAGNPALHAYLGLHG